MAVAESFPALGNSGQLGFILKLWVRVFDGGGSEVGFVYVCERDRLVRGGGIGVDGNDFRLVWPLALRGSWARVSEVGESRWGLAWVGLLVVGYWVLSDLRI